MNNFITVLNDRGLRGKRGGGEKKVGQEKRQEKKRRKLRERGRILCIQYVFTTKTKLKSKRQDKWVNKINDQTLIVIIEEMKVEDHDIVNNQKSITILDPEVLRFQI